MWLQVVFVLLIAYLSWKILSKPHNIPPGYWGLPLIGYISLDKKKSITDHLLEIRKSNGNAPVVSWRMGTKLVVFIFDAALIKEAFNGRDFLDRPLMRIITFNGFNADLQVAARAINGNAWHTTRRFTLHHLKNLGMGKSSFTPVIQKEALELVKDLQQMKGKPSIIPRSISVSTLNIIWQLVASKRYSADDKEFKHFLGLLAQFGQQIDKMTLLDFMPWIPYVIPSFLLKKFFKEDLLKSFAVELRQMLERVVAEHKKDLDVNNPKDFIDEYLIEMERQKSNPDAVFIMENLLMMIGDLFRAGTETTTGTFKWIIYYLIKYPEVQRRLQQEVDALLPKGTLADYADKSSFPFAEAVVNEALRHSSLVKYGIMHLATRDSRLGGYTIPKDSIVCPALFSVNYDSKYWDSPDEFRPDRFLDADGKFYQPKEGFYPFGAGKRQCLGESLARMSLFIFLTTTVQNLSFKTPPGKEINMTPRPISFINGPRPDQEILVTVR